MLKVFKLALAVLGLSCTIFAQDKSTSANTNETKAAPAPPVAETKSPADAKPAGEERNIRFQFDGIPYMDLVERFAQMANKPLISETNVQGTVTFNDPKPYNFSEAFETLNTILAMKNVMLVDADRFLRLVPFKDIPQMPLKIFRGLDKTGDVRPGEIVTIVMELKNLDPSESAKATSPMLSSAGSMAPLTRGRGLIITDRLENIRRIKQLLNEIDTSSPVQRQMRTYTLLHASGAVVADLINKTFGAATAPKKTIWNEAKKSFDVLPPDPEDYVTAVFDDASRTLLLFGPGERVSLAEDLIHRFEDKEGGRGGEVKIFYPHSTKAEDLAKMIRQAIPGVASENESGAAAATKARVIVDSAMNRLIVSAPIAGQLDSIERLINNVDGSGQGSLPETPAEKIQLTKVIRLNVADPATAFRVLTNAFTRRAPNGNLVQSIKANLDAQTKTIVVTGSPGDLEHALGIIDQMENITPGVGPMETAFVDFPSAAELKRVQPLIQQLYANQVADGTPGVTAHAKFIADPESRRLIVTASKDHQKIIQRIAEQLRSPAVANQPREFRAIALKNVKVDQVFKTITDLVTERMNDDVFKDVPKPLLLADAPNNRLLITANAAQLKEIDQIVATVDISSAKVERQLASIQLQSLTATQVLPSLTQLMRPLAEAHPDVASRPEVIPDATGKNLIVSAVPADIEKIREMVRQLEGSKTDGAARQFKSVKLYNRAPAEVVSLAEQLYREQLKGQPDPSGGFASFVPETKGNRVIVIGSDPEITRAEDIIRQIDPTVTRGAKDETRVLRLRNAQAQDLAGLVEKSLNLEEQKVKLLVDPRSNSVVISGTPAGVESAAQMIEQLDILPNTQPKEVRMIELKSAEARSVVPMLTDLLGDVMRNTRGSNYVLQSRIVADTNANRIIVTGTTDELQQINGLVQRLDTAPTQTDGTRVFQLNSVTATEMARIVSDAMTTYRDGGRRTRVRVAPDDRSNNLVVTGDRHDLQDVQVIIEKLDGGEKRSTREVRVVELQTDEPTKLVSVAQQVWNAQAQGRPGVNDVSMTLDPSGKRVVIVGPGNLLPQVEQMLTGLDQKPDGPPRNLQVVELKQRSASTMLPLVSRLYEEQEKGKKRRPATIVPEASGKRLMIYGSDEQVNAIREIVGKLEDGAPSGDRQTRFFPVGQPEDVARILPLLQQLYREQTKDEAQEAAETQILADSGRLIVTARTNQIAKIEGILEQLRSTNPPDSNFETRIYNLSSSTATELAQTVTSLYQDEVKRNPALSTTKALILPDAFANRLIVSGSTNQLASIEQIVKQLDQTSPQTGGTRVFKLKASDASQVASVLSSSLVELDHNTMRTVPRVSVGADTNSNSLVVSGQAKDLNAAAVIIEQLDSSTNVLERQIRILPLKSGGAAQFAQRVRALYLDHVRNQPASGPANALILGDTAAERIVVAASAPQLAVIEKIIAELDNTGAPDARQLAVRPLKKTSATSVATVIQQFFARNIQSLDPAQRLILSTSPDDRSLILEAPGDILAKVDELTETLEKRTSEENVQVRSYQLAETRSSELASTLTRLYAQRRPSEAALQPRFEADTAANLLLVAATADQFDEINKLIDEVKANAQISNEIRTFTLMRSDAVQIVPVLASMLNAEDNTRRFQNQGDDQNTPRRRQSVSPSVVRVAAAPAVNAVVVQGPPGTLKSAEQIIRSLDSPEGGGKTTIQTVRLKKAQAENVADAVNQTLAARGPRSNVSRATVTPVTNSNSLLIDGPAESVQDVIKIIQELDNESTGGDIEIRVYKLEHGKARELSTLISRMLDTVLRESSSRRNRTSNRNEGVTITADERTNSLIVSANPEHFKTVEQLLLTLDQNSAKTDKTVRFVILKNARAIDLSSRLNLLFEGRPRGERPVIEADTFANSITIIGSKSDIAEAEGLISELDQVSRDQSIQVRMLVVDNVPAQQMAKMLQSLYSQMSQAEIQLVDRLTPPPPAQTNAPPAKTENGKTIVTISVDRTANALLLSGPSHELDAINSLVSELTFSSYGNDAEFRLFALKEADPIAVAKTLTELFKPEPRVQQAQPGQQQPQQIVTPAPKMTIVAEPRTRSIVARGKSTDFILLESLIQQLDVKSPSAQLAFRLVKLEHADPQKVLPFITQMITQLGVAKPGDPVSVAADLRTRGIFAVGRETVLNEVEQVIKGLDTAPAFSEAEVAIVPLKHTVAAQLATILQNMLKPAATGEATAEARELQEQVRSLRIKNDDGKEVVLDLLQPIKIMADGAAGTRSGNRLLISSTADNIKALSAVIEMMDTVAMAEGVSFKIVHLENADASTVAETLGQIFTQGQRLATGPAGPAEPASETGKGLSNPLNISADRRSNSLILSGKSETLALAQRLLRDLDAENKGFVTEVRLFRLNYASATRLAPLLQTVFTEAAPIPGTEGLTMQVTRLQTLLSTNNLDGKSTLQPKVRSALTIQADDASNTLIVAARADMMPLIEDTIKSMDIPAATGMDTIRIYPLKNADATRLMRMITEIYAARGALMRPEEKPALTVDNRTNALIVSGNERVFSLVETLIMQLDQDLPFGFGEFKVIKLENADASVVASALQQIVNTRAQQKAALSAQSQLSLRAIVIPDSRINSIIIGGASEVFELVEALAKQLDTPGISLAGQIRLIPLQFANAGSLATSLNNLFTQRYAATRSADVQRNRPIILPDARINALLVSAGVEDNKALDELLQKLDQKLADPALQIEVIGLQKNDSGHVADMIQTIFAGRLQAMTLPGQSANPQDRVITSADPLSNALIVVANKENIETIRDLVKKLDAEPTVEGGVLTIIPLKNADATRVASMLRGLVSQGLYRPGMMSARGAGQRAREAMAIAVDSRSNTLIVSASPENLAIIKEVINQIDSQDYSREGDIRLYSLKHARASNLAQTLQQFFNAKRTGEAQGRENERTVPTTILADDRVNTLLVTGGKDAFDAVERMLAQLDTEDIFDKIGFRIVPLKNGTATKLQSTLTRLFANRPARITGKAPDPITIVADSWVNALLVGASVDDMDMVINLIQTLDNTQPENGMQVQVIPIVKGDATAIAQTVRGLYRDGPNSPVSVQVNVDERLNALVVSAGEADLKRITELVQKLDTTNVARVSEIRIFPLKFAQAEELAQTLTIALTGRPVEPTTIAANPNRQSLLQFITRTPEGEELVASALKESLLITADRRRNALVISAPADNMTLLARLIASLDSESPQLAKIRVFRLQNADARQMADVLTTLFRLKQQPGLPANQRAIQYTLVRDVEPGSLANGEPYTATIGSAEQYALTVTIDLRTNSLLLGGTDHYVGLASHIIEELDSSPMLERKTEVYRMKNAQARDVETALKSFLLQERQRVTQVQGETLGLGTGPASTQAVGSALAGETVQQLIEREVAVVAETNSNTLLLSASPRYFDRFKLLIDELDRPQPQVLIQVILAEVTLDKNSDLGVEWTVRTRDSSVSTATGTDFGVANEVKQLGGFSSAIAGRDISFVLRALEADGRLEVLSRPQILTADNQRATINIGQRIPLVTDSRVGGQNSDAVIINSYKYEDVGVILTVTPKISPDGFVKMEVEPTVSQLSSSEVTISPGVNVPIINQRKATTTVSVQNGQSVIIGGLIGTSDDRRRSKVPFLGNIPYLGVLFRSSHSTSDRKELLIILTPQLLLTADDGHRLTQDQLHRSTIKDEIRRDKLQQQILQPILPYFEAPEPANVPATTNGVALPPKSKTL
jgi:type II secretion system protein D